MRSLCLSDPGRHRDRDCAATLFLVTPLVLRRAWYDEVKGARRCQKGSHVRVTEGVRERESGRRKMKSGCSDQTWGIFGGHEYTTNFLSN